MYNITTRKWITELDKYVSTLKKIITLLKKKKQMKQENKF